MAAAWHAPRCNDPEKRGQIADDPRNGLAGQTEHWMAPNVPNGCRSTAHAEKMGNTLYHEGKKVQMGLEAQTQNWPAPAARDWRSDSSQKSDEEIYGTNGMPLPRVAMTWSAPLVADAGEKVTLASHQAGLLAQAASFRPPLSQDQPIAGGSICSTDGPNSNQPSVKRKLNVIFVEALMRWPTGLSGFERQEMAWTQWWLLMPSYLSALCSTPVPRQAVLL